MPFNFPSMLKGKKAPVGSEQTATAQHTASGAESSFTTVAATLPGGAVGKPMVLMASGSVGGLVQIQFGSQAVYAIAVAPNQTPVSYNIPASAFPNRVGSVNVQFQASAAGTLYGNVVFETD